MIVRCSASALLPKPYGVRGGYRAVFTQGAIESRWTAGYDGRPTTTLTEYTEQGQREVDLPARDASTAVIDHVIACCQGRDASRISPASVLDTLQLTVDLPHRPGRTEAAMTGAAEPGGLAAPHADSCHSRGITSP